MLIFNEYLSETGGNANLASAISMIIVVISLVILFLQKCDDIGHEYAQHQDKEDSHGGEHEGVADVGGHYTNIVRNSVGTAASLASILTVTSGILLIVVFKASVVVDDAGKAAADGGLDVEGHVVDEHALLRPQAELLQKPQVKTPVRMISSKPSQDHAAHAAGPLRGALMNRRDISALAGTLPGG